MVSMFSPGFRYGLLSFVFLIAGIAVGYGAEPQGTAEEKQRLHEMVIAGENNLFGDQMPIHAPERLLNRSWQEIRKLKDESLDGFEAVFYIFPEDGKPLTLHGALLPAGDDLDDLHMAIMHVRADPKAMARLADLPPSTLVYGVDGTGNKAWYPLKFFIPNKVYPGFLSSEGFYAYTYRPSAKFYGRYGKTAYYLNILRAGLLTEAQVVPENNITLLAGGGISADISRAAFFSAYAFYAPLIPLLGKYPVLGEINYEITILGSESPAGSINVKVPFGLRYNYEGDNLRISPARVMFDALEQFRSSTADWLRSGGHPEDAARVEAMDLSVTHFNTAGDVVIAKKQDREKDAVVTELRFTDCDRNIILRGEGEGELLFMRDATGKFPGCLEEHITLTGTEKLYAVDKYVPPGNWKEEYDTVLHGISRVPKPPRDKTGKDIIGPERHFELDVPPTFMGGDMSTLLAWLNTQVQPSAAENFFLPLTIEIELVINEKGRLEQADVWAPYWSEYAEQLRWALQRATEWTPGKMNDRPVKVRYVLNILLVPEE